jgi:O-succinylbenzoate synthase
MQLLDHTLREANLQIQQVLRALAHPVAGPIAVDADMLVHLLARLQEAGEKLAGAPPRDGGVYTAELDAYRDNLQQLREVLPALHVRLLAERAQLEQERRHLGAASRWAQASKETL